MRTRQECQGHPQISSASVIWFLWLCVFAWLFFELTPKAFANFSPAVGA